MFSFFKKKPPPPPVPDALTAPTATPAAPTPPATTTAAAAPTPAPASAAPAPGAVAGALDWLRKPFGAKTAAAPVPVAAPSVGSAEPATAVPALAHPATPPTTALATAPTATATAAERKGWLDRLKAGERIGTLLSPERGMLAARKQWLAGHLQTRGTLVLDDGAVAALSQGHKSLLPVGVKLVQGSFRRGEMVVCVAPDGREIARGLANYSALEAQKIIGQSSEAIVGLLGYMAEPELVHRDNLILV